MEQHIGEFLNDYLDDELNKAERLVIEKHLKACSDCKNKLDELTALRLQLREVYKMVEIPEMMEDKVLAKITQDTIKSYSGILNRSAVIMMSVFAIIFLAGTTPFLRVGVHLFYTIFSISRGLLYALPSIISAIPYIFAAFAGFVILLIVLALFIVRYLVHNMGKTVRAEDF